MNKYFHAVIKDNQGRYRTAYFDGHSAREAAESFLDDIGTSKDGLDDASLEGVTDLYDFVAAVCDENYWELIKLYQGTRPVSEVQ